MWRAVEAIHCRRGNAAKAACAPRAAAPRHRRKRPAQQQRDIAVVADHHAGRLHQPGQDRARIAVPRFPQQAR
jgi:hypothetical protein